MADAGASVGDLRPLLAFPAPDVGSIPGSNKPNPFRPVQRPTPSRQGERIAPQFKALRSVLEGGRAELGESTAASDPELVAVFELAGSVDTFLRAARKVDGLEFLAEIKEDSVEPDDDFYYEDKGERSDDSVPEFLYMVMTNAQAVTELVRLFNLWERDPKVKFARGLNPLKEVFGLLRGIRRWGAEDRVRETGLLDQWREDVEVAGSQGFKRVEIELWFRLDESLRRGVEDEVRGILDKAGAVVIAASEQPAIAYHAVLADVPMSEVERVIASGPEAIELLTTESVMMVSPSHAMMAETSDPVEESLDFDDSAKATEPPRVALLDGVPFAGHVALDGRLVIDDPDNHTARYGMAQRRHGTAMASLIAHGDLAAPGPTLSQKIYVRPIFEPHPMMPGTEVVPAGELLVDLVHRCFHRIFEGDGAQAPAAPSTRIVTLAVGDPARSFIRRLSPLARLLDWLSHLYNVVVVVSGGNQHGAKLVVSAESLGDRAALEVGAARSLFDAARHRRDWK